jgi:putative ABC transport system permease protein
LSIGTRNTGWPHLDLTTARLAFRNILRHRTRSAIAIVAIAFGVVSLLLAGGFIEWIYWALREAAIQTGLGHVHVVKKGYQENGAADPFRYLLPDASADLATLEASPEVKVVAPRLEFNGLVSHGDSTLSFVGEGVDPDREKVLSRVLHVPRGEPLSAGDPNGVLLGVGLAEHLQVGPGDPLVLPPPRPAP